MGTTASRIRRYVAAGLDGFDINLVSCVRCVGASTPHVGGRGRGKPPHEVVEAVSGRGSEDKDGEERKEAGALHFREPTGALIGANRRGNLSRTTGTLVGRAPSSVCYSSFWCKRYSIMPALTCCFAVLRKDMRSGTTIGTY